MRLNNKVGRFLFVFSFIGIAACGRPGNSQSSLQQQQQQPPPPPPGNPLASFKLTQDPSILPLQLPPLLPIAAGEQFFSIFGVPREVLFQRGRNSLVQVVTDLRNQATLVALNKADLFVYGYVRGERAIELSRAQGRNLHREQVAVYSSSGLGGAMGPTYLSAVFPGASVELPVLNIQYTDNWMDYSNAVLANQLRSQGYQMTFANFANTRLGGGWNQGGNVQEEQMVQQCPDFLMLLSAFNPALNGTQLHTRKPPAGSTDINLARHANPLTADPKLVTNLRCFQKLNPAYERQIGRIHSSRWTDLDEALMDRSDAPLINMIAMAAPELRTAERGQSYTLNILLDFFENAYTAFKLVKLKDANAGMSSYLTIGRWGAGAFGHNVNMSLFIQLMAAHLVFGPTDRIVFTGLSNDDAQLAVSQYAQMRAFTPQGVLVWQFLEALRANQDGNPFWQTR